jgi:DNA-binding CsgD family transcriptional regulator
MHGTALDRLGLPLALADGTGRLRHRTPGLAALLEAEADPRPVETALARSAARVALRAYSGQAHTELVHTPSGRYRVEAILFEERAPGTAPIVLLTVGYDTCAGAGDPGALRLRFGLTAREVEVARLLARRLSNAEVAEALGVSLSTARHHAGRVLDKLGVSSRKDVAAVLDDR